MTLPRTPFFLLVAALLAGTPQSATALLLSPAGADFQGSSPKNPKADDVEAITGYVGDLTELYKIDLPSTESGDFADNYGAAFNGDNSGGTISHDGGVEDYISNGKFVLVKDGNHNPIWYIFDISTWDGTESIDLSGFWPGGGEISHVSIFGGGAANIPPQNVPEPASLLVWGVLGLGCLVAKRRKLV